MTENLKEMADPDLTRIGPTSSTAGPGDVENPEKL
jgi:hypothetical protein